jgi:hypothetical protein
MDTTKRSWSPAVRVAVGSLGASLVGFGINLALRKRRYVGLATGIVGLGALVRSASSVGVGRSVSVAMERLRRAREEPRHLAAQRPEPADELPYEGRLRHVH